MSAKVLKQTNDAFPATCRKGQFNCSLQYVRMTNVCVRVVNGEPINATRVDEVPFLTNHVAVEAGEELLMEKLEEQPRPDPQVRRDRPQLLTPPAKKKKVNK